MNRYDFSPDEMKILGLRDGDCGCCWIVDAIGLDEFIAKRVSEALSVAGTHADDFCGCDGVQCCPRCRLVNPTRA